MCNAEILLPNKLLTVNILLVLWLGLRNTRNLLFSSICKQRLKFHNTRVTKFHDDTDLSKVSVPMAVVEWTTCFSLVSCKGNARRLLVGRCCMCHYQMRTCSDPLQPRIEISKPTVNQRVKRKTSSLARLHHSCFKTYFWQWKLVPWNYNALVLAQTNSVVAEGLDFSS